ncbi:MAG: DUF512 domain-containing protein [Clostridia bacterium]|nr:DUF512 domain-containing protein [Clostridia bacterium]
MLKVKSVQKNGIGYEIGIKKGDQITKFNGYEVKDILDYLYYDSLEFFTIEVLDANGVLSTAEVEKEENESLGLTFVSDGLEIKNCHNKCIFCFVDQMPKGMRPSLYVKDDDYRQSFLCGNFVTLTNLTNEDIERIIRLKLSPLYVSVQVTDAKTRAFMLNNRFAGDIMDKLERLANGGISIETQVVLVPKVNDGALLEKTILDLHSLSPYVKSVAVVPCGITAFREGLYEIENATKEYCKCVIEQVREINYRLNENFVVLGDEFYFKAGLEVENYETYGNFSQLGNGVGTTAKFKQEVLSSIKKKRHEAKYLIICGESASDFIKETVQTIKNSVDGLMADVMPVKNDFFGHTVNCTGLLTGGDILKNAIKVIDNYDALILPDVCLKQDEDVFLDGVTLKEFRKSINKKIIITLGTGQSFFDALSGGKNVRKVL